MKKCFFANTKLRLVHENEYSFIPKKNAKSFKKCASLDVYASYAIVSMNALGFVVYITHVSMLAPL